MSVGGNPFDFNRDWMYNRINRRTRSVREEFERGCEYFIECAKQHQVFRGDRIWCPCKNCMNQRKMEVGRVYAHLYNQGFTPNYTVWTAHGEQLNNPPPYEDIDMSNEESTPNVDHGGCNSYGDPFAGEFSGEMGSGEHIGAAQDPYSVYMGDPLNAETAAFFNVLDAAQQPLYDGCVEGLSKFSVASDMMFCKTKNNVSEETFNDFSRIMKHILPEGNIAAEDFYETEKVMKALGMPYMSIDVCKNNCMIYWTEADSYLMLCKFCEAPRYKPEKATSSRRASSSQRVPYKKMWYLPIADRLKRLYLSDKTASHMRWHANHFSVDGNMEHPSDGLAWKHFNEVYPDFASNHRNVYLGLCTDGFNPFGFSGANYSLWPVMLTPYNLPPDMCMKRDFMFLSLLVPGPNHPKRSLDIFLQPLIDELNFLWTLGIEAFDISVHQTFNLRAVLLWTISDFPAFGMLSGWTTHGKLGCPYCMGDSDAFYLTHGRKNCWFDCHRRFLPEDHDYRENDRAFKKETVVVKGPPNEVSSIDILEQQLEQIYGLQKTTDCGGNGHINDSIEGYLEYHNWHKFSIFWELPYWKTHLLRHNLDVMHIEKNVFDNIFNTVFNVTGKTKDTVNSRKDVQQHCCCSHLHLNSMGRAPVPIFRMPGPAKTAFLKWLKHERMFDAEILHQNPDITPDQLGELKQQGFASWLLQKVRADYTQSIYPLWVHELAKGPIYKCICWERFYSRGYTFHTVSYGQHRRTANYGISVRGSSAVDEAYYGKLQQIIEIAYHGAVRLKVTLFRCDWFDNTPGIGTRMRKPGLVEVFANGSYQQYDPFIFTTQADQVCFLSYPRVRSVEDEWLVVVTIKPRGIVVESTSQQDAVQEDISSTSHSYTVDNIHLNSLTQPGDRLEEVAGDPILVDGDEYGSDVALTESSSESDSE